MKNTNPHYTYVLIDPRTSLPFYVGKGSGDRDKTHLKEAQLPRNKQSNQEKCSVINDILSNGMEIKYKRHWFKTAKEAYTKERQLVKRWGRKKDGSGILTNLLPGGKGGASQSVYVFDKHTGNFIGLFLSQQEAAAKLKILESSISACLNGKAESAGDCVFSRTESINAKLIKEQRIELFELPSLRSIGVFNSTYEAAAAIGVNQTLIHNCLTGYQPQIRRKYIATYKGAHISPQTIFVQYDKNMKKLKEYSSLSEVIKSTKIDRSSILRCFRKTNRTAGGFIWKKEVRQQTS